MPRGHLGFEEQVRGASAIKKLILRRMPGSVLGADMWNLLRHAEGLNPRQIVELAWDCACIECGAVPEGLRNGAIEFRCPNGKCIEKSGAAREVHLMPDLFDVIRARPGDLDNLVQRALEKFSRKFPRSERLPPQNRYRVFPRLKRYQELIYRSWTPAEFSDHVQHCLKEFLATDLGLTFPPVPQTPSYDN